MERISALVITYNEENNISDCLDTLMWCDEIIIIDSKSSDRTTNIASKFTKKIFSVENLSFSEKKNLGVEKASYNWILCVDADERVTQNLKTEIRELLNSTDKSLNAYYIKRKSFFISKFIKYCGWYPDYVLRLFRKSDKVRFSEKLVHEKLLLDEKAGKLRSELIHYTDLDFEHYVNKMNLYSSYSAEEIFLDRKKPKIFSIIFRPVFTFIKMYFLKLGFLDGYIGLVLCTLSSIHVFAKYSKHYFLTKNVK